MRIAAWGPWLGVVVVYVAATCLAVPFTFILFLGLTALGFETGWWPGDPTMNDGEGVAVTLVGLVLLTVLFGIAGLGAWRCLGSADARGARRWVPPIASTALFLGAVTFSMVAVLYPH